MMKMSFHVFHDFDKFCHFFKNGQNGQNGQKTQNSCFGQNFFLQVRLNPHDPPPEGILISL